MFFNTCGNVKYPLPLMVIITSFNISGLANKHFLVSSVVLRGINKVTDYLLDKFTKTLLRLVEKCKIFFKNQPVKIAESFTYIVTSLNVINGRSPSSEL